MKQKQTFTINVEKTLFNVKLKLNHLQMFFKILALKNFAILRIKKRLHTSVFL